MKQYILVILCLFIYSTNIYSQDRTVEVSGTVMDEFGEPLMGVNITVKNAPGLGVISDIDGNYKIKVAPYSFLVFSYIGCETQEQLVKEEDVVIHVTMLEDQKTVLDEITITGTGAQKKITLTGAITTVDVNDLKTPTSSVANALAGNVAGVMARQTSGQPGNNTSEFWIRGISTFGGGSSALVLVDGFERSLNEINVEDIESFTVLKDASTTAIYGSRGANGVIVITTKRGTSGKVEVEAKAEYTYTQRTYTPQFVDGPTYATLLNEALTTRNRQPAYSSEEIMMMREGLDPDLYSNVDWMGLLLKKGAPTYRANMSVKGGGTTTRYYLSGSYINEGGIYKEDKTLSEYKTNANYERYNYRLNLDLQVTQSTLLTVGVSGTLEKQNHAAPNTDHLWHSLLGYNPVVLPVEYSNGYTPTIQPEPSEMVEGYYTPWVLATQTGYAINWKNKIETNISLEQKLDFVTKGLKFNARFGYDTFNENYIQRRRNPEMWRAERLRGPKGELVFTRMVTERDLQQFSGASGLRKEFFEAELVYQRTFGDHSLNGIIKYTQDSEINTSNIGTDFISGIDRRHQGVAGNIGYGYKHRYYFNFNFGYNGSENFAKGHQFGFFPAYSAAWNIAEESFIKENFSWLEMFKIRYSYGKTGNDNIGKDDARERFPFLAEYGYPTYYPTDGVDGRPKYAYNWGDMNSSFTYDGLTNTRVSSNSVTWEYARKHDIGIDLYLFGDKFGFTVDYFNEKREGIYMERRYLPGMVGLQSNKNPYANLGSVSSKGFDGHFSYAEKIGEVNMTLRGNFTYSKNEILEADEQNSNYPYTREAGYRVEQRKGLIAQGLFKDYDEIRRSPTQFGEVLPGDIKYKDINGDGVINDDDIVPIGATERPNLIYGFGLALAWKGFDVNVHFQGAGKSHFFTNGFTVYPFSAGEWGNILTDVVKSGRWILGENEDPNAKYPRLSYGGNANNYRASTHWLRNGSYLRLKTLEAGYTFPKSLTNKFMLRNVRVFFIGQNLLTFAKFKLWDPELGSSDGQKYPLGKTYTVGLSVNI